MGENANTVASTLCQDLRAEGYSAEFDIVGRGLKPQMRYANKVGAKFVCVLGDNEIESGEAKLKNMRTGTESPVNLNDFKNGFVPVLLDDMFELEGIEG